MADSEIKTDGSPSLAQTTRDRSKMSGEGASTVSDRAFARGARYGESIRDQHRGQPVASVLMAAGVGFVAGLLLARR